MWTLLARHSLTGGERGHPVIRASFLPQSTPHVNHASGLAQSGGVPWLAGGRGRQLQPCVALPACELQSTDLGIMSHARA